MAPAPAVSVVIPTYNRAGFVGAAIESVLRQTWSDFEIIVVDDGSTDDTETVVRQFGKRVRYVRTRHGGIARARNLGMELARGRYFAFLDSDDLLYPYALELEVQLLDRFPDAAMVCAEMTGFDDNGFEERYHLKRYHASSFRDNSVTWDCLFASSMPLAEACPIPESLRREDPAAVERRVYRGNVFDTYLMKLVLCQNTAMIRREVVAEIGPRREHVYNYEEYDYLLRLSRHHDVVFADVPTYKLRYHSGQISTLAGRDGLKVWIRKQRALLLVFRRHAMADPAYYATHRLRLDRRYADLCRAAAVPMMLVGGRGSDTRNGSRMIRCSRLYLARCRTYGSAQPLLLAASLLPGPARRLAVRVVEGVRQEGLGSLFTRAVGAFRKRLAGPGAGFDSTGFRSAS